MVLVLRYVDKNGEVVERFVGLVHVSDTLAFSLKEAIYSLLLDHLLSPSQIRGQGYDGATNMRREISAMSKKYLDVEDFFCHVTNVFNVIGVSFKRRDLLRHLQAEKLEQLLESGEIHTGQGLNQERGLQRPGDTRWGSHFKILDNFIVIFSSIIRVLEVIEHEGSTSNERHQAKYLLSEIITFKFVFMLQLMLKVLVMSNELNKILQKRDQDIVNAVEFLYITNKRLQDMRETGWESLLDYVSSFCHMHDTMIPKMDESYFLEKSKRKSSGICYSHHLRVDIFYAVIDVQLQELNDRFDVVSSDLLLGMASLNPVNSFANFDKGRIMTLAKYYPNEFDELTLILPIATATMERAFSSMKQIKNEERNIMGDQYLNDCLVCYIERDVFTNGFRTCRKCNAPTAFAPAEKPRRCARDSPPAMACLPSLFAYANKSRICECLSCELLPHLRMSHMRLAKRRCNSDSNWELQFWLPISNLVRASSD
uniref:Zinc finger MYM-type protein 1-like n=1 Tax=Nicotiana tabacum TaxID=4097 RepID=A0A1S3Y6C3_TOBAC|nr:PREDICTED: zinc finger MYM-type protein 1-like [Nicotiana tabacum]